MTTETLPLEISRIFDPAREPLGRQALAGLATLLREPMPEGFVWNFIEVEEPIYRGRLFWRHKCGAVGCAIGLLRQASPRFAALAAEYSDEASLNAAEAQALGISVHVYRSLFGLHKGRWLYGAKQHDDVLPADVADAIDRYLATGKLAP